MSLLYLTVCVVMIVKRARSIGSKISTVANKVTQRNMLTRKESMVKMRGDALSLTFRMMSIVLAISAAALSLLKINTELIVGEDLAPTFCYSLFGMLSGVYTVRHTHSLSLSLYGHYYHCDLSENPLHHH
jgi:hypothetical protein